MIAFELTEDKKSGILPLDEGYPVERSEDFFTNMSGLNGVSSETPSASSASCFKHDAEEESDDKGSGSHSSANQNRSWDDKPQEETKPNCANSEHQAETKPQNKLGERGPGPHTPHREYTDMKAQRIVKSYSKLQSYEFVSRSVLNKKVAAMSDPKFIDARRLDNLRRAWDVPHRAHGPQQPGMWYHKGWRMIPSPD